MELAGQLFRIEHIGVWTLIPFIIVVVAGLSLAAAWVLRAKPRPRG